MFLNLTNFDQFRPSIKSCC